MRWPLLLTVLLWPVPVVAHNGVGHWVNTGKPTMALSCHDCAGVLKGTTIPKAQWEVGLASTLPSPPPAPPPPPPPPTPSGPTVSGTVTSTGVLAAWTAPSAHSVTDWISLYAEGAPDTDFARYGWQYVPAGTSGTLSFAVPPAGRYTLRYFLDDTYTQVAESAVLTVGPAPPPVSGLPPCGPGWSDPARAARMRPFQIPTTSPAYRSGIAVPHIATDAMGTVRPNPPSLGPLEPCQ